MEISLKSHFCREFARVVIPGGKSLIQTTEKGIMRQLLEGNKFWNLDTLYLAECGGFEVGLYLMKRTEEVFPEQGISKSKMRKMQKKEQKKERELEHRQKRNRI